MEAIRTGKFPTDGSGFVDEVSVGCEEVSSNVSCL